MPFSEIKSWGVAPFFYIKMIKRRTLQACNLKYSIQKETLSALDKMDLFRLGKGESNSLPPPPHPRPLATRLPGRLVLIIFAGSSFSVFLLTLLKAHLSLDDVTSTSSVQSLYHFAQFCCNVSAILPSDLK